LRQIDTTRLGKKVLISWLERLQVRVLRCEAIFVWNAARTSR